MPYSYEYPHPAVATDIAIFSVRAGRLVILLIQRSGEPFAGAWALPGGFLRPDETLDACARRELREETGVEAPVLLHVSNFSGPRRDPRERVISVAYFALMTSTELRLRADNDAADARWFPVDALPSLAFDHAMIVDAALEALRSRLRDLDVLFALLPDLFTLSQLQTAYEAVAGTPAEKRNFRKLALASGRLEETGEMSRGSHRPARLYRSVARQDA